MASELMKREVIFILMFIFFLVSISFIYATEESQVEDAYSCLENRINQTGCSSLKFEEKVFSYLAIGKCGNELSLENLSNECWPKSGCTIKSTAQAILALNKNANTTKAENWVLRQTAIPQTIDWFLEIEVIGGATTCKINYPGSSTYTITIGEDKKISSGAGSSLTLTSNGYWLNVAPSLYNKDIEVSCDKEFLTTLLFTKKQSSTVHVSDTVNHAGAGGRTIERVDSLCFAQGGNCNYEGSLWAALVLASLDHEDEISKFMPYLITMKDDALNQIYIPESFLYYLTGKFKTELLLKQRSNAYWEESGNRYYDTALALLPLGYEDSSAKSGAKSWLLSIQDKSGCWNNGNLRDTAFLLYSIWPKDPFSGIGRCDDDWDCPDVDCKSAWCSSGKCVYEYDDSCINQECSSESDCPEDDKSDNYCGEDGNVYYDTYSYSCNTADDMCETDITEKLVDECSGSESCDEGECVSETCSWLFNPCDAGYDCISGKCVPEGGECDDNTDCEDYDYNSNDYCYDNSNVYSTYYTYSCNVNQGKCVADEGEEKLVDECSSSEICDNGECIIESCSDSNPCESGYDCLNGECVPDGSCHTVSDCPIENCKKATCDSGTCLYEYICEDECDSDVDCEDWNSESDEYCNGDDVYIEVYNYTCDNKVCVENVVDKLVNECSVGCEWGECLGGGDECTYNDDCTVTGQICDNGYCVDGISCYTSFDCYSYEYCDDSGFCAPSSCEEDIDCNGGKCSTDGYCVASGSECESEGYWCTSSANCNGNIMQEYSCSADLFKCCDTEPPLMSCSDWNGEICTDGETCLYGTVVDVSDSLSSGEECCVEGECGEGVLTETYCIDEDGTCRDTTFCEDNEQEEPYLCDYEGQICCVPDEEPSKGKGWILIVILLILIILAALGVVFRDKLRTEWIKIKDKFSGKKEKKKFDMPMTMHPNPQGRILPRRILPPGQNPAVSQQQSRFPMRTMGQPISHPQPTSQVPLNRTAPQPQYKPSQPAAPGKTPQPSYTPKKVEEKPKNGELDDVLKKLKEMGNK